MLRLFEAPKHSNLLLVKNRVLLSKLAYVGKIMANSLSDNMCRRALINGKLVCKGKDSLTEREEWSKNSAFKM